MTRAVVIPVEGPIRSLTYTGLPPLQEAVGGYIEALEVGANWVMGKSPTPAIMWLNETGKLDGLPRNVRASLIAGQIIAGDVVLTGPGDAEGYETDLDDEFAQALLSDHRTPEQWAKDIIDRGQIDEEGGPYVIRCLGYAGVARPGQEKAPVGGFLASYDPEYRQGAGVAEWTRNPTEAMQFRSKLDAWDLWSTQSRTRPLRADGQPNKPLTAFSIEVSPLADFDYLRMVYQHVAEDGDHRRRSMREMN